MTIRCVYAYDYENAYTTIMRLLHDCNCDYDTTVITIARLYVGAPLVLPEAIYNMRAVLVPYILYILHS